MKIDLNYIKSNIRRYTSDLYLIDELTSIVSIKYFERDYHCENQYQFKKLIRLIIRSAFIDYYRKAKSNKVTIEELDKRLAIEKPSPIDSNILFENIDKLNDNQKDVILLRYFFNLKYADISHLMGLKKNTVLSHSHSAKLKLRTLLTKKEVYDYINY